jgi:hypothetical protein
MHLLCHNFYWISFSPSAEGKRMHITQCFAHNRIGAEMSRLISLAAGAMCFAHI